MSIKKKKGNKFIKIESKIEKDHVEVKIKATKESENIKISLTLKKKRKFSSNKNGNFIKTEITKKIKIEKVANNSKIKIFYSKQIEEKMIEVSRKKDKIINCNHRKRKRLK